jgi:hypothetical protein
MIRRLLPFALLGLSLTGCRAAGFFAAGALVGVAVASHPHEEIVYVEAPPAPPAATPAPPPAPVVVPPPPQPVRFDAHAAHASLQAIDLAPCRDRGVPAGARVHAIVTFAPSGNVQRAVIDQPGGLSRDAVQCLAELVTVARAPSWEEGGAKSIEESWAVP